MMKFNKQPLAAAVLTAITSTHNIILQASSVGDEFLVNTHTYLSQTSPSIAMDNQGNHVVIWESFNQDGDFLS